MAKVDSRYTNSVSFRSIKQEDILSTRLDDLDRWHKVAESLEKIEFSLAHGIFPGLNMHWYYMHLK